MKTAWIKEVGETIASVTEGEEADGTTSYTAFASACKGDMCFQACTGRYGSRKFYKTVAGARRAAMRLAQMLEQLRR